MGAIFGLASSTQANSAINKTTINNMSTSASGMPVGCILVYVGESADVPSDMLLCDGSAISRTTFPELFAVIGTNYGAGNGSTTFNLPNFVTSNRIPIGLDSAQTEINTLGKSGGSFNHTHAGGSHQHTFSHSHTISGTHQHTYDHFHTMPSHTHTTTHGHGTQDHRHSIGAHGHTATNITYDLPDVDHYHEFTGNYSGSAGNTDDGRNSNVDYPNGNKNYNTSSNNTRFAIGGSIGSGTDASVNSLTSGSPSVDYVSYNTYTSGGPSTNNTSSVTGSVDLASCGLDTYSGNTDFGGSSINTLSSNPPYVTVNFIIKAIPDDQIVVGFQL
jgi:microcystin-dependent protein